MTESADRSTYNDNVSTASFKLSHQSFRIEKGVIDFLESEAMKRDISVSNLVNKILKNYTTSEMYFEELGFMLVSKDFLRKIFSNIDERKLEEVGRELGLTVAREYVSYFYSVVNCETLVKFLDLWFKRFQSFQHRVDNTRGESVNKAVRGTNRHYFAVNHDINYNFSVVLRAMLEGLIEPVVKEKVEFKDFTANAVVFVFDIEWVT